MKYGGLSNVLRGWMYEITHFRQRRVYGFDDSELWNLDKTLAQWLGERLTRLADITHGAPSQYWEDFGGRNHERWTADLREHGAALVAWAGGAQDCSPEHEQRAAEAAKRSMDWVACHFMELWD